MAATESSHFVNDYLRKALFLPAQGASFSADVDHLHYFVIITTFVLAFGIGLTTLLFVVLYKRRKPGERGVDVSSTFIHEVFFVGTPLAFFLLWFGLGIRIFMKMDTPPENTMDVYVVAKQWMWKFNYADGPVSVNVLRVPVGRPVRLLLTSRDVIHSFYVPAFREKRDVVPGRYTELWFQAAEPGSYRVFCAEYCGANHSYMRASVEAMPADQFDAWMAAQREQRNPRADVGAPLATNGIDSAGDLAAEGQRVAAQKGCFKCHSVDGTPHVGPTWLGLFGRIERLGDGSTVRVDEPYMTESMMDPTAKLVAGFQPVMPSYQGKLTPADTAAIIEFIKSLRDAELQAKASEGPSYGPR